MSPRSTGTAMFRGCGARAAAWALSLYCVLGPGAASAQPTPPSSSNAVAVARGREGVALYERGEWAEALRAFEEAEAAYHSPVLVLYAARSHRHLGHSKTARDLLQRLRNESIGPAAPPPWKAAQADAALELEQVAAEIPRMVVLTPGRTAAVRLTIDGRAVLAESALELDPGEHTVTLQEGDERQERRVTLRAGDAPTTVRFDPPARAVLMPPAGSVVGRGSAPTSETGSHTYRNVGIVLAGLGGAALIGGGVLGVVALNQKSSADAALPGSCDTQLRCPEFERDKIEAAYQGPSGLADASTALLVGGAVVTAVGLGLWVFDPGSPPRALTVGRRSVTNGIHF